MNEAFTKSETNVAVVLQNHSKAVQVFVKHKTACVGCALARFCTIEDVINIYKLDENIFLDELEKVCTHNSQ